MRVPPTGAETGGPELDELRAQALKAVRLYAEAATRETEFVPGESSVEVAGRVVEAAELEALVDASLDGWLTEGRFARRFVEDFAATAGRAAAVLTGSGSQANLLAMAAARSHLHERPLQPGDEVITPAVGFPTTVNPIYQQGLVPVYVDVELDTLNPSLEAFSQAVGERTRGIVAAHCLGNPFDAAGLERLCSEHDLILIEDCCDALGSTLAGRPVGTFGAAATYSFYPAHHMTTGEGGAVATDDPVWTRAVASLREWGRDCWCEPGTNNACGRRFDGHFGTLPAGYDHKFVFSHVGFNFKVTDMQAALGLAQLDRVADLGASRRSNFARLSETFTALAEHLLPPRSLPGADPSWFGYPLVLREGDAARRRQMQLFLRERRIDSRLLLAGNLTRQPGYLGLEHRVDGPLPNADRLTETALWIGVHPRLTEPMLDWMVESVTAFFD